jgi:hypothetical protein
LKGANNPGSIERLTPAAGPCHLKATVKPPRNRFRKKSGQGPANFKVERISMCDNLCFPNETPSRAKLDAKEFAVRLKNSWLRMTGFLPLNYFAESQDGSFKMGNWSS